MRLHVRQPPAPRPDESVERGHLVEHQVFHLVERQIHLDPTEVLPVRVPRMRADADAARQRQRHGPIHHAWATRVHAASDVRGSEEGEQRLVVAALADVRVQVDAHRALRAARACSSVTLANRILCPGRACAKRRRSAPITHATRG